MFDLFQAASRTARKPALPMSDEDLDLWLSGGIPGQPDPDTPQEPGVPVLPTEPGEPTVPDHPPPAPVA